SRKLSFGEYSVSLNPASRTSADGETFIVSRNRCHFRRRLNPDMRWAMDILFESGPTRPGKQDRCQRPALGDAGPARPSALPDRLTRRLRPSIVRTRANLSKGRDAKPRVYGVSLDGWVAHRRCRCFLSGRSRCYRFGMGTRVSMQGTAIVCISSLLLAFAGGARAATYYVRNGGDENADGRSHQTAWATLGKVNSFSFSTGDDVLFHEGHVFTDGVLEVDWSGTSSD